MENEENKASEEVKVEKEEPKIPEPVWEFEKIDEDEHKLAIKLRKKQEEADDTIHTERSGQILEEEEEEKLSMDSVKTVMIRLDGYDRDGKRLPWFKQFWGKPEKERPIRPDWKYFLNGMKNALKMLKVGEKSWFAITPAGQKSDFILHYPVRDEDVYISLELISVSLKKKSNSQASTATKQPNCQQTYNYQKNLNKIKEQKSTGDQVYNYLKDPSGAISPYIEALKKIQGFISITKSMKEPPAELAEVKDLQTKVFNNLGLIHLKLGERESALGYLDKVLKVDPDNPKANHRKARCLELLNDLEGAVKLYRKVKDPVSLHRVNSAIEARRQTFINNWQKKGLSD